MNFLSPVSQAEVEAGRLRALTVRQAALLEAAAARILPTTSTPGATEAGVIFYIDQALAEVYGNLVPLYRGGCRALDRHARQRFGQGFLKLSAEAQDDVLRDLEGGQVEGFPRASQFFDTLRTHTMEGFFGEPSYGGNRDLVGWRLVGFPGHQFGYPDPYIDRRVDLEPVVMDGPFNKEEALRGKQSR